MSANGTPMPQPVELNMAQPMQLKMPMPQLANKTPVSVLQELCAKRGITPKYDLLQVEGVVHEPTFLYRCTVDVYVAKGNGLSKKRAKHTAAKAVLDMMVGYTSATPAGATSLGDTNGDSDANGVGSPVIDRAEIAAAAQLSAGYDDGIEGNPVGRLQELCMNRRWPPPTYELNMEQGQPHERTFTLVCNVGTKYKQTGVAKSKKVAKRQAADLMLRHLQDTVVPCEGIGLDEEDEFDLGALPSLSRLKDAKIPTLSSQQSLQVSQFHRDLKSSTGAAITELKNTSLTDNTVKYVQFLQELASEQRFEVTWVDVDELTHDDRFQCLVQLSTMPVAVCFGTGKDPLAAKTDAAYNALEYLKIMVKE